MTEQTRKSRHNKERSKAYFQRRAEMIKALNPRMFNPKRPSVLTKSIRTQIMQALPDVSEAVINKFLGFWVSRDRYLNATMVCPKRMNLNGSFAEEVTREDKQYARAQLLEKRKKSRPTNNQATTTGRTSAKYPQKSANPSSVNERRRKTLEKAGKGLNFELAKPPQPTVKIKKRRIIKKENDDG